MNPELEKLVQDKIDAAKLGNNGTLSEEAKASIQTFILQYKEDQEVKKAQDSQISPAGESTTPGLESGASSSTTDIQVEEPTLEVEVAGEAVEEVVVEGVEEVIEEVVEEVVYEVVQQDAQIVSDRGDGWEYKRDNGVYYTKKAGGLSWTQVSGDVANSIAKDVFPEYGEFTDIVSYVEEPVKGLGMFEGIEDKFTKDLKKQLKREHREEDNFSSRTIANDLKGEAAYANLNVSAENYDLRRGDTQYATAFLPNGGFTVVRDGQSEMVDSSVDLITDWYNEGDNSRIASNPVWSLFERVDRGDGSGGYAPALGANPIPSTGFEASYQFNDLGGMNEALGASGYTIQPIYAGISAGKAAQYGPGDDRSGTIVRGYRVLKDGKVVLGGAPEDVDKKPTGMYGSSEEDINALGGTFNNGYAGINSSQVQTYFWNLANEFHAENGFGYDANGNPVVSFLQDTRELMIAKEADIVNSVENKLRRVEDSFISVYDDPTTIDIDETTYTDAGTALAFSKGLADNTMSFLENYLEELDIPDDDRAAISTYLNTPTREEYSKPVREPGSARVSYRTKERDVPGWQKTKLEEVLESEMYASLSDAGQEAVRNTLTLDSDIAQIKIGEAVDQHVSRRRSILLESAIANTPEANSIRGVLDERVAPHNVQAKLNAFASRQATIEDVLQIESDELLTTLNGALAEVEGAGYGYHSEGDIEDGTFRLIIDAPEGVSEADRKVYQKKIDRLYNQYDTIHSDYVNGLRGELVDYLEFVNESQDDIQDLTTVSRELDRKDVELKDWNDAWKRMWWGTTAMFGSEKGLAGLQKIEDRGQAYRNMLTGSEAYAIGEKGEYASRTFTQQLPNLVIAMGTGGAAGSGLRALGMGARTIKYGSSAATGFGVFAPQAAGQKRKEVYDMRTAGVQAQERLDDLSALFENGDIPAAEYYAQKGDLEKTIALGDISDFDLHLAMATTFFAEGSVMMAFGTALNSQKLLRSFGGQVDDVLRASTNKWYQNLGRGLVATGKETASEVTEESLIYMIEQVSGGLIFGKDANWSGMTDVVLSSIISAGPTQGAGNVYNAFTSTMATQDMRHTYQDVQANVDRITASMEKAKTPVERDAFRQEYLVEVSRLTNLQAGLEMDALIAGPSGLKTVVEANQALLSIYNEAGVKSSDSQATIDKKLEQHKKTLSGRDLKAFNHRLSSAQTRISDVHTEVARAHEDGSSIERTHGEEGLAMAEKLAKKPGWEQLSNRDKALAVHKEIQRRNRNNRINSARGDDKAMEEVEMIVYGGKFSGSGRKNRNRKAENSLLDAASTELQIRQGYTTTSARDGNVSLEAILKDPLLAGKFEIVNAKSKEDIIIKIDEEFKAGRISMKQRDVLIEDMEEMFSQSADGTTFGAIVSGKYITIADTDKVKQALEDGEMLQGTVAMHEVGHAIDTLIGMEGEGQSENFAVNLEKGLRASPALRWIDMEARKRVDSLKHLKKGSSEYDNEYTKAVGDLLGHYRRHKEFSAAKKLAGRTSISNWFRMATSGLQGKKRAKIENDFKEGKINTKQRDKLIGKLGAGFKIDSGKSALNFMVSNIEAFRKGELSQQTRSLIKAPLSRDFDGTETRKSASPRNKKASADIQTTFENEYQNESNADIKEAAEGKILAGMAIPISNMARKVGDWNLPGFDQEILESEITSNKTRGALSLVRDYDLRSAKYTLKDGSVVNALVSKKGGLTINGDEVAMSEDYFKDVSNPTQGEIDTFITDQYGAIETRDQVPVAGYVFQQLRLRMPEFIRKAGIGTEKGFELNIDDLLGLGVEEDFSEKMDTAPERVGGMVFLADRLGNPDEDGVTPGQKISNKIMDLYNAGEIDAEGKTYKTLGVHPEIADMIMEMMGIEPKPGNLSKPDIFNAQRFIDKYVQQVRNAMPLQHTSKVVMTPVIEAGKKKIGEDGKVVMQETLRPDKATGIPNVLLEGMFDKGTRKDNLTPWLPKDMLDSEVRAVFGITERKEQNLYKKDTNTSARIRGMVKIFGLALTNQAVKVAKIQAGDITGFAFEDGKNQTLFSKTARDLINKYDSLGLGILSMTQDATAFGAFDVADGNVKAAMRGIFQEEDKIELLREEFGDEAFDKDGNIKKAKLNWLTKKLDKIADELQVIIDPYIKAEESGFEFVMDDRPIQEIIMGHIVNDATTHRQYYKTVAEARTGERSTGVDLGSKAEVDLFHGNITGPLSKFLGAERSKKFLFPAYSAAAKIGRGRLVEINGKIVEDPEWDVREDGSPGNKWKRWSERDIKKAPKVELTKAEIAALGPVPRLTYEDGGKLKYERAVMEYNRKLSFALSKARRSRAIKVGDLKLDKRGNKIPQDDRKGVVASAEHASSILGTDGVKLDKKNSTPTIAHSAGKGGWTFKRIRDAVKQRVEINRAQREANQAFRDIAEWLKAEYEAGNISVDQVITLLETFNANPKALTRMAAIFDFAPTRPFDGVATLEHMTPALDINLKALDYILSGDDTQAGVDFNDAMDNYRTAFLPKKYDDIVNEYYRSTVPYWQTPDMSPLGRYYGPELFAAGFDLELEMLSTGTTIGGKTGIDAKAWKLVSDGRRKALGSLGKGADQATVEKTRRDAREANRVTSLYSKSGKRRGMSAWDFDDTLATTKSNVLFTAPDGTKGKLNAEEFAKRGGKLLAEGYEFDFSEFNKVTGGKPGPMFDTAIKRAKKFGTKDTFILTARNPEAAPAIKEFLDALGLNIPLKNITGLGDSTGEAKARWLLDKHAKGYNDIYFADDAMQNVKAVQDVFNEFDIKGKVEQAKTLFSRSAPKKISAILEEGALDLNTILEQTKGVSKEKTFSIAKARQRGKNKGKFKFFVPPSADDFAGLMYAFMGKGKQGDKHHAWFKENLFDPFSKGMRRHKIMQQEVASDIKNLRKAMPDVRKKLNKKVPGTEFTHENAIRIYNWNKAGFDIPGLSKADEKALVNAVESDAQLQAFAQGVNSISNKPGGMVDPGDHWTGGNIALDLKEALEDARDTHLQQWIENKNIIFSEVNMNKIEAVYGSNFREALEDSLWRMENGGTRSKGGRIVNNFTNWIHGSIGTTMFLNARSAMLQMISNVNFVNWSDNNMIAAAKAFANQPQYWKDVVMIMNSPFLKQRRSGIQTDVNAAELLAQVKDSNNKLKAATAYLLQFGFTPTQIADSFAIATGGATMYRNRVNTYLKEGMTRVEAETKAFEDMMEVAEETQQSTREDKISQQQASPLGKFILAFQNTPMQYNRLIKKAALDLVNGRGDQKANISRIVYYGAIQNMIFYGLQQALFAALFSDDEEDQITDKKKEKVINGMIDTILRGSGIAGVAVSTVKNVILKFIKESEKMDDGIFYTDPDWGNVVIEGLNMSPPVGIKARKIYSGLKTWEYNKDVIDHMSKTDMDNPIYDAAFSATEAVTNIPLSRVYNKVQNISESLDAEHETWKRVAMFLGWSKWNFGIKNQDVVTAKSEVKEIKAEAKAIKAEEKKIIKAEEKAVEEAAIVQDNIRVQKEERKVVEEAPTEEKKEQAKEKVTCAAVNKSGKRCGSKPVGSGTYCTVHEKVEARADGKKTQCSQVKSDGKRCKMKTTNKSGKCYYHD